jgi:hypothetical protein
VWLERRHTAYAALALGVALMGALTVAMIQGPKPFYYDSGLYWGLGESFTQAGHFSLLNFNSPVRGYALPLAYDGLRSLAASLAWSNSSIVKLFNALVMSLIGSTLAPMLAERTWATQRWGPIRRLALAALFLVFWSGWLNFPLSDFPALALAMAAIVACARSDRPGAMFLAGAAGGLALDVRAAYVLLLPVLLGLAGLDWFNQRWEQERASALRRCCCLALLLTGFAGASLPQSLSAHRYHATWSFVPGAPLHMTFEYLNTGLENQLYDTYVGPELPPQMFYADEAGMRLLLSTRNHRITNLGQYVELTAGHPLASTGLLLRHLVNGLDVRYTTPYIEHVERGSRRWLRIGGFLIVFLALLRLLWPAARRGLGPSKWRYPVALLLCSLTSVLTQVETRYVLPFYVLAYILVLMPGWPNPIKSGGSGRGRFRTLASIGVAYVIFMAVVWHIASTATHHLHFG